MNLGNITLNSSIEVLNKGFQWAKEQALFYAHHGEDPVGLWYEAALPDRNAFCVRDVCHQAAGAAALGLSAHTKNMLYQFAKNISIEKDYCTWWEITKEGKPCPDDYKSDKDFWYNLPANFEIIRACYLQYLWTGDKDYITDPVFLNFYELSCNEYVEKWDVDGDGLLEHYKEYGIRGIASYNEADVAIYTAGDMLGCQYAAYGCYAKILELNHREEEAQKLIKKQQDLKKKYIETWYNEEIRGFYGAILSDGSFYKKYDLEGNFLPLLYGILNHEDKMKDALRQLWGQEPANVEGRSYLPQIYYECGDEIKGFEYLVSLCDPQLYRREYPEVSYALIGTVVNCLMGINTDEDGAVVTRSRLLQNHWAKLSKVSPLQQEIDVAHGGKRLSALTNHSEKKLVWKAAFSGHHAYAEYKGQRLSCCYEKDAAGIEISFILLDVAAGETAEVRLCD